MLFGIFNTRSGISVELFTKNLIYGTISYFLISLAGTFLILLFKFTESQSRKSKRFIIGFLIITLLLYLSGLILVIIYVIPNGIIYFLNSVILVFTIYLGFLWGFLGYFGYKYKQKSYIISIVIISLCFSLGLLYGAFLNIHTMTIPIYIFFFFFCILLLQLSRELLISLSKEKKEIFHKNWRFNDTESKLIKYTFGFELITITCLIFLVAFSVSNSFWYLLLTTLAIIFISIAGLLTIESLFEKKLAYNIHLILKIGILINLITLLLLGS
ncbi:MAG: hypothetical protein ACFE9Z_08430 [Promethearchaeota archaeon]